MNCRSSILLVMGAWLSLVLRLPAQESAHLEFVRALRDKGMADLALQYLESKRQKPPAELASILPLELGKSHLLMAIAEPDTIRRRNLRNQARIEFEAFLKDHPNHPLAAEARMELARIAALQGRERLARARRLEGAQTQPAEIKKARQALEDAGKLLATSVNQIEKALANSPMAKKPQAADENQALTLAKLQAELEIGINLLTQAQTYTEQSEIPAKGKILKSAIEALERVAKHEAKSSLSWLALAWLGRCHQENDDPKAARTVYATVMAEPVDQAEAARRLAGCFRIQALAMDRLNKNRLLEVQRAGADWILAYPYALHTPEGQDVHFELANAYFELALGLPKPQQQSARGQELFDKAQKHYQVFEQTENEYTKVARENRLNIILKRSLEQSKGDIAKLKDFESCFFRAQYEIANLHEAAKKLSGAELDQERKQHYAHLLEALNRGLDLSQPKDREEEIDEARSLLAYTYLVTEDYYRAAVVGEDLARTGHASRHAPTAGIYALRAYSLLLSKQEQAGIGKELLEGDRNRVRQLAEYIEQTWPNDPAADAARHVLGLVFLGEKKYAKAIEVLSRISGAYADITRSLYQLAGAAFQADKEGQKPATGQPYFHARALEALERIPDLAPNADFGTIHDYFNARLVLADVYYRSKQFDKLDTLATNLGKNLDELDEKTKTEQRASLLNLTLYAKLGRAEAEYAGGRFSKAREMLEPVVKQLLDPRESAVLGQAKEKDPQVVLAVLGLALRTNVQDNQVLRGIELLELLRRTFADNYTEVLAQLVQRVHEQIDRLRREGDSAKPALEQISANFKIFLDNLAKQQEKNPKSDTLVFLAQGYSVLEDHKRGAELANSVPQPKSGEGKDEAGAQQLYQLARVLYGRELRLNKQFKEAEKVLKSLQNLEGKREAIFLLQDQERYAQAGVEWNNLMTSLRPRMQDNKVKELYFDCYYHLTYCYYKNAFQLKDTKKKTAQIRAAATLILRLEEHNEPETEMVKRRFQEFLGKEPELKAQYEAQKMKTK